MENKISIKPTLLSSFVPEKDSRGIYEDNMRVNLVLQLGTAKGTLTLMYESDYTDPSRKKIVKQHIYGFDQISSVVDIDISEFLSEYVIKLPAFIEDRTYQKAKYRTAIWQNSWVHSFIEVAKNLYPDKISCTIPSCENFVADCLTVVPLDVKYLNFTAYVKLDVFDGKTKYVLPYHWKLGLSRDAHYNSAENLLKSFIKRADDYYDQEKLKIKKEEAHNLKVSETIAMYEKKFGNCSHQESTETNNKRGLQRIEYKTDSYYIVLKPIIVNDRNISRKVKISSSTDGTYTLGSFSYLSESDVIKIINIVNKE